MGKLISVTVVVLSLCIVFGTAVADEVSVSKKKTFTEGEARGYIISYRHKSEIGEITQGKAKVFCKFGYRTVYLVNGLDRGDGRKMDLDVGAEGGGSLAQSIAPGYMSWAIDVWRKTCG